MNKSYLPSKQFRARLLLVIILVIIVLIITKVTPAIKNRLSKSSTEQNLLVKDMVAQDSNSNGIADWEEALWGLDPKGDGIANKQFIFAKKQRLSDGSNINDGEITDDNEKLAREFFALLVSLKQNGNLDEDAIVSLSNLVGQKVVTEQIPDIYTKDMLETTVTTPSKIKAYYTNFTLISSRRKANGIGDELQLMGQALANNDREASSGLRRIANEYRSFGQDIMTLSVPTSLDEENLKLANLYEKNAQTIEKMSNFMDNPIAGMASLVQYKKYNDELVNELGKLRTFFVRNGIIKE